MRAALLHCECQIHQLAATLEASLLEIGVEGDFERGSNVRPMLAVPNPVKNTATVLANAKVATLIGRPSRTERPGIKRDNVFTRTTVGATREARGSPTYC